MTDRVQIIAEVGVNHNGSLDRALEMIDVAASAKVDAVKFQTFKADKVVNRMAEKAAYQKRTTGAEETQYEMVKKLELANECYHVLKARCEERGVEFISSPFDLESVDFLANELGVARIKIASGEITNGPLLLKAASTGKPIILSTGMSTLAEIETALGVLAYGYLHGALQPSSQSFDDAYASTGGRSILSEKVVLLHCTTEYPAPYDSVNLNAMETIRQSFGLSVGYSDHTEGITVPIAAVALGAVMIEKHFTLDNSLPGPDHAASVEPDMLAALVGAVRNTEASLGVRSKHATSCEVSNSRVARRSMVAATEIEAGEVFTERNLTAKRPGTGISPMEYWGMLGKAAKRDYGVDEVID